MTIEERNVKILNNINLVHSIAHKYRGIEYEDAYGQGIIGLIKAVDGFDEDKGNTFSTYAYACITNSINQFIRETKRCQFYNTVSLDQMVNSEDTLTIGDVIPDRDMYPISDEFMDLKAALKKLTEDEKALLFLSIDSTQNEIAISYNVSQAEISRRLQKIRDSLKGIKDRRRNNSF
jgi:RNA polymerase sigma factor (sigma-70 family)